MPRPTPTREEKEYRDFDMLKCSKTLKKIILDRANENDISLYQLCKEIDVDYEKLKRYLNANNPIDIHNIRIVHNDILRVCDQLGINVRLTIVRLPIENIKAKRFEKFEK